MDFDDLDVEELAKLVSEILQAQIAGENENIKQVAMSLQTSLTQLTATQVALAPTHAKEIEMIAPHVERRVTEYEQSLRWRKLFTFGITAADIKEKGFEKSLEEATRLRDVVSFASHPGLKEMYQAQIKATLTLADELVKLVESEKVRSVSLNAVKRILKRLVADGQPQPDA
ncbi:hypothetical protein HYR54_15810 [Candidatus Acetothermia bacterium]|nr:hypothetical protein [Candidatus Acetothermia bacterium]